MKLQQDAGTEKLIYYRLIALWVFCEAMLGGIIHGAKIPVSGLIVGSCAVICISLIAYYAPAKGFILKATLIVAIFKLMLSPQAPPTAYFAVFFQGLLGEALFWNRKGFAWSCLIFATLVLLESGLQRIVILTIVYGNDLWPAINTFINGITGQTTLTNYSFFLVSGYVLIHFITGVSVGLWSGRLPQKIQSWTALHSDYLLNTNIDNPDKAAIDLPPKKKSRMSYIVIWFMLLLLYLQSTFNIGDALLSPNIAMRIFIRSLLMILTYYFLVGPCVTWLLRRWLQKRKVKENEMIEKILQFLPNTQHLVSKSWQLSSEKKGGKRILLCSQIILLNTLYSKP